MTLHIGQPLGIDGRGRTRTVTVDEHVRSLVEAVLFTAPGERVGRPDFGSGLRHLVFGSAGDQVAVAMGALVHGALQRWLDEVIEVESVEATSEESTIMVTVSYVRRRDGERMVATFGGPSSSAGGGP